MRVPVLIRVGTTPANLSATRYFSIGNPASTAQSSAANAIFPVPVAVTVSNLRVMQPQGTAPGVGNSLQVTLGTLSSPSVTITDAATDGSDAVGTATFAAADRIYLVFKTTYGGTNAMPAASWAVYFEVETVDGSQPVWTADPNVSLGAGGVAYASMMQSFTVTAASAIGQGTPFPTAGTISGIAAKLAAPLAAGSTANVTLVKNGADTPLTFTLDSTMGASPQLDTSGVSVGVVAGDQCYWRIDNSANAAALRLSMGWVWTPTTAGEGLLMGGNTQAPGVTNTAYVLGVGMPNTAATTTGGLRQHIVNGSWRLGKLIASTFTSPGVQWTFTARDKAVVTALVAPVVAPATQAQDTVDTADFAAGDLLDVRLVAANGSTLAAAAPGMWSAVVSSPSTAYTASTGDVAAAADGTGRAASMVRAASDGAPAADAAGRAAVARRAGSDSAPAIEAPGRVAQLARGVSDAAAAVDAASAGTQRVVALAESAPAADAGARRLTQARGTADAAPAADAIDTTGATQAATGDAAPAVDTAGRQLAAARAAAETVKGLDAVTRKATRRRTVPDTAHATDALARVAAHARGATDSAPADDALARVALFQRALAELAPAVDAADRLAALARALGDSAPAADVAGRRGGTVPRGVGDVAPAADAPDSTARFGRRTGDAAPAADLVERIAVFRRALVDGAPVSEAVGRAAVLQRATDDDAPGDDGVDRTVAWGRVSADDAPAADDVARSQEFGREVGDLAPASEAATGGQVLVRFVVDHAPVSDVAHIGIQQGRNVVDAAPAVDGVGVTTHQRLHGLRMTMVQQWRRATPVERDTARATTVLQRRRATPVEADTLRATPVVRAVRARPYDPANG